MLDSERRVKHHILCSHVEVENGILSGYRRHTADELAVLCSCNLVLYSQNCLEIQW